jgi:hypothetical protein
VPEIELKNPLVMLRHFTDKTKQAPSSIRGPYPVYAHAADNLPEPRPDLAIAAGIFDGAKPPVVLLNELLANIYEAFHRIVVVKPATAKYGVNKIRVFLTKKRPGAIRPAPEKGEQFIVRKILGWFGVFNHALGPICFKAEIYPALFRSRRVLLLFLPWHFRSAQM